ncbi:MAG TPA: VIT domain-containing protein [Planctomycetota bacterium]|nr:VIT domain-containing protein [Planctomycetota bacterium]
MTCDQSEQRMAEYLAGEIRPAEQVALERHLLECESCRDDFEFARAGARVEWTDVPVPASLLEATLASIQEPAPAVRFFRWATAAAALLGVAVLLVTSGRSRPSASIPEPPSSAAACSAQRTPVLATMQEPVLGALACQDDAGRPVGDLGLRSHEVSVEILDGIAKTTVEEDFENHTDRRLEGAFTFPLPSDASISRLALEVNGKIEEGTCLERERAREVFESIVRRMQDPALLEWQPGGLFRCRIFPIEPRATKRVIVAYTQTLPCFQGKMQYVYPLSSEKTRTHPPSEVRIRVLARFSGALARMESTSHHLDVQRKDAHEASMSFRAANYRPNNDFVVTLEPAEEEVRVVCHRPPGEDGYFACFATPRAAAPRVPQKYTFVLDASASISAPRLEVAKRLVRAMMERKIDGDRFEVLAHSIETWSSGEVDLRGANTFMDQLHPIGGSDVLRALLAAGPGEIIYVGKGQPTFGETETARILEAVRGLRIRAIAVGSDANLPLLERLGGLMRITPNDEVDKRVGEIASTLGSPVISGLRVEGDRLSDVSSARDVFAGERLVAVGRYRGAGTGKVVVRGRGYRREVEVVFPELEEANNPVRRLWAQRKAADLAAEGELKKAEIAALGVKYQIMTPYTSFLVLENEQMWKDHQLKRELQEQDRVLGKRMQGQNQSMAEAEAEPTTPSANKVPPTRDSVEPPGRLKSSAPIVPQGNSLEADEHYRLAERHYTAVDVQKVEEETQKALRLDPNHAPSRALNTEALFILNKGKATPSTQEYDGFLKEALVRHPQILVEADRALENGRQFQAAGDLAGANREYRKVVELSKWMTTGVEVELRRKQALELANQTGGSGSPGNPVPDIARPESRDPRPNILTAPGSATPELLPSTRIGESPASPEKISSGLPMGVQGMTEEQSEGQQDILDKLASIRISADLEDAPLTVVVDYLREVSGLNIHLAGIEHPDSELVTFKARDSVLGSAMNRLLQPRKKGYVVRDGIILITSSDEAKKLNETAPEGGNVNGAPRKALEGKVTATATEIGLVVISLGKDDGVLEGDEFEVSRGSEFVAKVVVDRADRKWAAGKVVLKKSDPEVGDDASHSLSLGALPLKRSLVGKVTALAAEMGLVVISLGKDDGVGLGDEFAVRRGGELVARILIDRAEAAWAAGKIILKEGDPKVSDQVTRERTVPPRKTISAEDRLDRQSAASLESIRAKMGLKE